MDAAGLVQSVDVQCYANCGANADLSMGVMSEFRTSQEVIGLRNVEKMIFPARCMTHIDNVYRFPRVTCDGILAKTNLASNTAFRLETSLSDIHYF